MSEARREEPCDPVSLPPDLSPLLKGRRWSRDLVGESGGSVYRLQGGHGERDLFLKHGVGLVADDVTDEMVRLKWLAEHVPVPAVVHFSRTDGEAWLLMTALEGRTAWQIMDGEPDARPAVVDALADFLGLLHATPVDDCPFNSHHRLRLRRARRRIDAGLIEIDDFDEERKGWTAEQVWDAMHDLLPFASDPVVTHGDCSLDNLLLRDGKVIGCIDVGRAGVADRYQDIAILWNGLGDFGPALQDRLIRSLGVGDPDRRRLAFHLMLDELF